jgi:hypothetical protein
VNVGQFLGERRGLVSEATDSGFSEAYPYVSDFAQILANVRRYPAWDPPS